MMLTRLFFVLALAVLTGSALRQDVRAADASPYAGQEQRDLKSLSPEEVRALEEGSGMGLAKAAELNRYPGPRHVLDLAAPLELTEAQRAEATRVFDAMHGEAVRMGREILSLERELDQRFRAHNIGEADLARLTDTLGRLNGQLRANHLRAHLRMRDLLTADQVERYQHLRGYGAPGGTEGGMHHMHRS